MNFYSDELEKHVAEALLAANIQFRHESQGVNQRLDFYLPELDIYLEVKKFHSDRSNAQLATQNNVILIQGRESVKFICSLLVAVPAGWSTL